MTTTYAARRLRPGEGLVAIGPDGAVLDLAAVSPLKLIAPRNHGRAAWVVAASLGGGIVDGDLLRLEVAVAPGAAAYLSTQASTKVYPGRGAQELSAEVGAGGLLVALPDPVVCFAGASYRQRARVRLGPGAGLVWLEALGAGRTAYGERWKLARYDSRLDVDRAAPCVRDALLLDPAHGPLAERMGRFAALATLVTVGLPELAQAWRAPAGPPRRGAAAVASVSPIGADGAIVRLAAESMPALLAALKPLLAPVAELLGEDPAARRW
jgi:urease accessory protein